MLGSPPCDMIIVSNEVGMDIVPAVDMNPLLLKASSDVGFSSYFMR